MSIQEDIYTQLSSDSNVTVEVSTRIYPLWLPQDSTLPAVTYQQVSETPSNHLGGEDTTERQFRFQFDHWAESYSAAQSSADAVTTSLLAATSFKAIRISRQESYEPDVDVHRVSVDFSLWQ